MPVDIAVSTHHSNAGDSMNQAADHYGSFPRFTHVRSIFAMKMGEDKNTERDLMTEVHKIKWSQYTSKDVPGHFNLTLKSDTAKEEMEKEWQNKVQKGELTFQLLPQNQPEKQKLTLGNLPEECKTSIIQSYLEKYVINPQVTIIMDIGE